MEPEVRELRMKQEGRKEEMTWVIRKEKVGVVMDVWFLGRTKYWVGRTNEWVANPLGPGQTSELQIKTRSA